MRRKSAGKPCAILGFCLSSLVIPSAWAGFPNAIVVPNNFDYHAAPLPEEPQDSAPAVAKAPDLFGETTGPLPLFGKEIRKRGYELPDPYGIGVSYMDIHQNIKVSSIELTNLKLVIPDVGTIPVGNDLFNINVGKTREKSKTTTARLDTWLFPFMNIYGVVGHTKGRSVSKVNVCAVGSCDIPQLKNLDFILKFKGTTWGGGTTLAYGYHNWFGTMDFNYTETHFDILDGDISAFTYTPRVGYRFTVPGSAKFSLPESHASVWLGTMYQNVDQDFRGNISDLHMPAELNSLVNLVNADNQGRFRVKQHLKSPWNMLVGAQYEITRNFNITSEVGFAKRNSLLVSGEFRF